MAYDEIKNLEYCITNQFGVLPGSLEILILHVEEDAPDISKLSAENIPKLPSTLKELHILCSSYNPKFSLDSLSEFPDTLRILTIKVVQIENREVLQTFKMRARGLEMI